MILGIIEPSPEEESAQGYASRYDRCQNANTWVIQQVIRFGANTLGDPGDFSNHA